MAAKLTPEQWEEIGRRYAANISFGNIAKEFGVSRAAIHKAAKRYGWTKLPEARVNQAVNAKLTGATNATREDLLEKVADDRATLIRRHQREWRNIALLRNDAYAVLTGEATQILKWTYEEASNLESISIEKRIALAAKLIAMYEADTRALNAFQEGERRANGFDYKEQKATDTKDENAERERKRLLASLTESLRGLRASATQSQPESAAAHGAAEAPVQ